MSEPKRHHAPYVLFVVVLWGIALPGVLVADAGRGVVWRAPALVAVAVVSAALGIGIVVAGARHLAGAGIGLFGVRAGVGLVTDGPYAIVRNPIDIGTTLIAIAVWLALDLELIWVVPVAALISFVAAAGPYEDRLLVEAFGEDFKEYRRSVWKWLPRRG